MQNLEDRDWGMKRSRGGGKAVLVIAEPKAREAEAVMPQWRVPAALSPSKMNSKPENCS